VIGNKIVVVETLLVNVVKTVATITMIRTTTEGGKDWKLIRKLPMASDRPDPYISTTKKNNVETKRTQ
jgi:hypothetical protein